MVRFYWKLLLFVLMACFCILFGVDVATRGMERIQGPISGGVSAGVGTSAVPLKQSDRSTRTITSKSSSDEGSIKTKPIGTNVPLPIQDKPTADYDTSMNRVGNKIGDLLQIIAHHGIDWVVSLFDTILG